MAENWYVGRNGTRTGPFTPTQLREMAATGQLQSADLLWREGMANWVQASSVSGLFAAQRPLPPAPAVNPYAAPAVGDFQVNSAPAGGSLQFAEYLPRVGAALLDGLFIGLMACIPAFGIGIVIGAMSAGGGADAQQAAVAFANCCSQILSQVIGVVYYVVLETSQKQGTWGKQIVGIKVVDLEGNRLTVGRALGRYFAKFITGLTCGIGLLMPLWTEKKQTLHDMIAGCLAVKK